MIWFRSSSGMNITMTVIESQSGTKICELVGETVEP